MELDIETVERDGASLITVTGDVDLYTSPRMRAAVMKAIPQAKGPVAVDLRAVAYMDSSGVATLIEGLRAANQKNVTFVLLAPSPPVMKVLQLSRLDAVFDIREEW
jgi:anti-sigma B factor antagonist